MSAYPRTCPACLEAQHERHQYGWGLNRWKGSGCYCPCEGECVAMLNRESRMFLAYNYEKKS